MRSECGNLHSAKMEVMNWFLLVVSGCVELVFTYCLSKASKTEGLEKGLWSIGTASAIALSLYIRDESTENLAYRNGLCRLDGYRRGRYGYNRYRFL